MKKNEIEKSEELIEIFSDLVYEKVLSKIKYLEYRDEKTLNVYSCSEGEICLVGLRVKEHSVLNLNAPDIFTQWNQTNSNAVDIVKTKKKYLKERGEEVFDLLQNGCFITDDKLFTLLNDMIWYSASSNQSNIKKIILV